MRRFSLILSILLLSASAFAQGYRGKDFWLAFPQNAVIEQNRTLSISLFISAEARAKGTITVLDSIIPFSIETGASLELDLDTLIEIRSASHNEHKAVHVTSDRDISLYAVSHRPASTDSYMAIPIEFLGREYMVAGYTTLKNGPDGFTSQAAIVGTDSNTLITVHLLGASKDGLPSGRSIETVLQKGEVFQVQGSMTTGDITGSTITSTKPVAVFTGHACAQVPATASFCDILLEEEPPMNDWGTAFVLTKFSGKDYYLARVIAGQDGTEIFVNGKSSGTFSKSSYIDLNPLTEDAFVHTSKPVLIEQFGTSASADSIKIGDPFMLLAIPSDRGIPEVTTNSVTSGGFQHNLNIVVPDSSAKTLSVDGSLIGLGRPPMGVTVTSVRPMPAAKATVLSLRVAAGRHMISCSAPVEVYSYGFGVGSENYDSYGHGCGMRLSEPVGGR